MRLAGLLAILLAVVSCASPPVSDEKAEAALAAIETRLLETTVLRIEYAVEASGAVDAALEGELLMQTPGLAAIGAEGEFAGAGVRPVLVTDGLRMRGGTTGRYFDRSLPADLRGGLLLGLTRMGILHNLAMLSQGGAPEGTSGDVRDWARPVNVALREDGRQIDGRPVRGIAFDLEVGGEPSGEVVLWFDPESGFPVAREQRVRFDTGDMRVIERYSVESDGVVGPCRFDPARVPAG